MYLVKHRDSNVCLEAANEWKELRTIQWFLDPVQTNTGAISVKYVRVYTIYRLTMADLLQVVPSFLAANLFMIGACI